MFQHQIKPRRVVITGFGCVTPIGIGRENYWQSLKNGVSGVSKIESFDVSDSKVKIAAQIKNFDWEAELNYKDRKHVPRTVPLALAAAREAVKDANLQTDNLSLEERQNFGVILGTGGGGLEFTGKSSIKRGSRRKTRNLPVFIRFRLRLTAVYRPNFQWFSIYTDFRISFQRAARVRPTRFFTPRSTSRSDGKI